jgi:hypothetical protein
LLLIFSKYSQDKKETLEGKMQTWELETIKAFKNKEELSIKAKEIQE